MSQIILMHMVKIQKMEQQTQKEARNNDKQIIPEIIYIKYEGDEYEKVNGKDIIIHIKPETVNEPETHEYHDEPELFPLEKEDSEHDETRKVASIEERFLENLNYDNEISSAVSSIEHSEEYVTSVANFAKTETSPSPTYSLFICKNMDNRDTSKFLCKICDLITGCIYCLKSHYETIHLNLGPVQYKCSSQISYNVYYTEICPKCKLVLPSREDMLEHRKTHFVQCDICGTSFDSPLFLSNHCKGKHEAFEVILNCDLCEDSFRELIDLSDHFQNYHEMIICIVCLSRFDNRQELEEHHKTHAIVLNNAQDLLPFACSKCDKAFSSISDLSKHLSFAHAKKRKVKELNVDKFIYYKKK